MNEFLIKTIRISLNLPEDGSQDEKILQYNANELFNKMLEYEGIIGYFPFIVRILKTMYGVDLDILNQVSVIEKIQEVAV
jgi:hypothetical protein